jgi:formylglycine-generating enzyme required for sulfatase activity
MLIASAAMAEAGRERDDNALHMKFRWCPPGSFHLGRLPAPYRRFQEFAPLAVTLRDGFWMGRYEVTQAQWLHVMGLTLREQRARDPSQPRPVGDGSTRDHVGEGPDHPIYFTSYDDAVAFCRKMTADEREAGRLEPGWEYRLPDEAQWEYACRAGTTTATACGDGLDATQANFDGTKPFGGAPTGPYLHETTPVGRYPANAWGLHDMHGNVWEWCRDFFEREPVGRTVPAGSPSLERRTYRGGCWHNDGPLCLSTSRVRAPVDSRGSGLGFRVALVTAGSRGQRVP